MSEILYTTTPCPKEEAVDGELHEVPAALGHDNPG
jgi:hypothetical protein